MNGEVALVRLRSNINWFINKERSIAEYVLKYPREVGSSTIGKLAQDLAVSPGLIVRFSQRLGFQGFKELKQALNSLQNGGVDLPVSGDYPAEEIVINTFENAVMTIEDTLRLNDLKRFHLAASLAVKAPRIEFFGKGGSARTAENAARKFVRWKPGVSFHRDTSQQYLSANSLGPGCLAIGISYSGETDVVVECLQRAKQSQAVTISVTASDQSSLAKTSDIVFLSAIRGEEIFGENEFVKIGQTVILDALYYCFVNELKATNRS